MDFIQIIVLALVQGLTEFLPISSSAHLILMPNLLNWPDQGLAFDVAVHVGTLSAVMIYFRREIMLMTNDWARTVIFREQQTANSLLAWWVVLGTIPVGIFGLLIKDIAETHLREPLVIAATTIIFGLLLWFADAKAQQKRTEYEMTWRDVLIIGCAQALALIPGTSRSGITITAGLLLGLTRQGAARFSFLLSIPAILLPGALKTKDLVQSATPVFWSDLIWGILLSGVSAFLCIHFFLKIIEKMSMLPFVVYRLLLGVFLVIIFI